MSDYEVLLAMSDTGGGHRSLCNAVADSLATRGVPRDRVAIVDCFRLGRLSWVDALASRYGDMIRLVPKLYGGFFHATNQPPFDAALRYSLDTTTAVKIAQFLAQARPSVIVSAHALLTSPLARARRLVGSRAPYFAIVTELVTVHRCWNVDAIDRYFTATVPATSGMIRAGVGVDRVERLGLPVDKRCRPDESRRQKTRSELGLKPNDFCVLMIGGGEGAGQLERLARAVAELGFVRTLIVCGRNERLRSSLAGKLDPNSHRVYGYVDNVPDLMLASDVVVTKGGPQTLSEALACGRPALVTSVLPGQEEGNESYVEQNGAGYAIHSTEHLVSRLSQLAADPQLLRDLSSKATKLGSPDASDAIADRIAAAASRNRA